MTPGENKKDDLWGVQVSIAKATAKLQNPSLIQLHRDILEEIGHRPNLDLVDFFVGIANISENEIKKYFQYIGMPQNENVPEVQKDPFLQLADNIACGDAPTVLKFRQAYINEYGEPPSEDLTEYFLKKMQSIPRSTAVNGNEQEKFHFAEKIARSLNPTVLKLRHEFTRQYGTPPSDKITQFFLTKIERNKGHQGHDEDYESKVNFTKIAANGHITTILHFRKAFEKAYAEAPSAELIDLFIKNMPRKGRDEDH